MYRKTEVLAVHGAKIMENLEKVKINHKNYFNQEFGTVGLFKEIPITDVPLFERFKSYDNLGYRDRLVYKSYAKKSEYIEVIMGGTPPKIKTGDKKTEKINIVDFLLEHNSDIDFLIKYRKILENNFYSRLHISDFFPEIPKNIIKDYVEIEWEVINIEVKEDSRLLQDQDENGNFIEEFFNTYKITYENKTIPHSTYYHFDEGLLRVSNHWGSVGRNRWYLSGNEYHEGTFKAGFIPWEDFEVLTKEEYYAQFDNLEEDDE